MKYVSNVLLSVQQPRHKIAELIDYDAEPHHKPNRVTVHKGSNPSNRLVANARLELLPAKPGRVIADHSFKFDSYSPWDAKFPLTQPLPVVKPSSSNSKYNPNLINYPKFRKIIERPAPMLFDEFQDPRLVSYSPWDEHFPKSPVQKRKSRNHSSRHRRHLHAAMEQYKAEHGPISERPVAPEVHEGKKIKSYSPWQEEDFARVCNIPPFQFIKLKNRRPMRPFSFSPWSDKFPVFKTVKRQVSLPKPQAGPARVPAPPTATPFPAFSPLHKRGSFKRNSITPSTSAMDMVESYEMQAGLMN